MDGIIKFTVTVGEVSSDMTVVIKDGFDWPYYRERVFKQLDEYANELVACEEAGP